MTAAHDAARAAAADAAYPDETGAIWQPYVKARPRLTLTPTPDRTWMANAACHGLTDAFYPGLDRRGRISPIQARRAKAICAGCDVRAECLQWALDHEERDGVWGGLTPGERNALQRGGEPDQRCGTVAGTAAHHRRSEKPCDACRIARNQYMNQWKARTG